MPGIGEKIKRATAALLAILLACGPLTAGAVGDGELFSVFDTGLRSLTSTAGSWNKTFQGSVTDGYVLTLPEDEESFRLRAVPEENDPDIRPEILFDGEVADSDGYSPEFSLPLEGMRRLRVEVNAKSGRSQTYTVTACRTAGRYTLRAVPGAVYEDGSRQVAMEVRLTPGTRIDALDLALRYDSGQLQMVNPSTNAPSSTLGVVAKFDSALLSALSAFDPKVDNKLGRMHVGFALKTASGAGYTASDKPLMTLYFRLAPGGALTDAALALDTAAAPPYGASFLLRSAGVSVAYDGIVRFEGLERTFAGPAVRSFEGGTVVLSPDKVSYRYGETVTVTAVPAGGYGFAGWTGNAAAVAAIGGESKLGEREVFVTLWEDADIATLEAAFEKLDETTDEGTMLDFTAPYRGTRLMAFNPPYGTTQSLSGEFSSIDGESASADEAAPGDAVWTRGEPDDGPQGLTEVERFDQPLAGAEEQAVLSNREQGAQFDAAPPEAGEQRTFWMRDTRKSGLSSEGWTEGAFTLRAVREAGGHSLYVWLCNEQERQPVALSDAQIEELADSFADSYTYLAENYELVRDRNGNSGLDILLYDIYDDYTSGKSTYTGGFTNSNEFYGLLGNASYPFGNTGDILHLDTWPQMGSMQSPDLEKAKSTMAHETQHLSMYSSFESSAAFYEQGPPTWINEGLSLTVEHALFGPLHSRIEKFNASELIRKGDPLTVWGGKTDDYAQTYLFFQYLRTQTEDEAFAKAFYRSYASGEAQTFAEIVQSFAPFADKSAADAMRDFYLALLLKEGTGAYGFRGDTAFDEVRPQLLREDELPKTLESSGAVYVQSAGSFTPAVENAVQYAGVTEPTYLLSIGEAAGGSAQAAGHQMTYARGAEAVITATPEQGWRFVGWTGDASGVDNPLTLRMDGDKTVAPVFEQIPSYTLTLQYDGSLGTVEVTDEASLVRDDLGSLPEGTRLTLTAKPRPGAEFLHWTGEVDSTRLSVDVVMDGDLTVGAAFASAPLVAAVGMLEVKNGEQKPSVDTDANLVTQKLVGGTVVLRPAEPDAALTAGGELPDGTPVILRAEPDAGKVFRYWRTFSLNAETNSLEETYGAVDGEMLDDTALRQPVLRTYASGTAVFRAVFTDAAAPTDEALRLSYLKLLAPEGRNFIQSESRQVGFSSTVNAYDLYLVSTDAAELMLNAVCKGELESGVAAEVRHMRGISELSRIRVEDYAGDETADGGAPELHALPVADAQDGDLLVVRVWDGTADETLHNDYRIRIHRTAEEDDPRAEAVFQHDETDGYVHLSVYLKNVAAEAATISIRMDAGALSLYNRDETLFTASDALADDADPWGTGGLSLLDEGRYRLEKARFMAVPDSDPAQVELELTVAIAPEEPLPGVSGEPEKAVEILCKKDEDAAEDWFDAVAPVMLYDADRLELEFTAKVTERLPGHAVTGTFYAYNPRTAYTADGTAFRVYVEQDGGVLQTNAVSVLPDDADAAAYGLRTFVFSFEDVAPGTYTLTVRKPGHTPLKLRNIEVGAANLDLDTVLQKQGLAPPTLTVGDVDGDGWVRTADKVLLMNAARYGKAVAYGGEQADPNEAYDLNGDGYVRTSDLTLLMKGLGRGTQTITLQSEEANA